MADTKISAMTAASALTGAEIVPLVQGGVNVRSTIDDINAVITNHGAFYSVLDQNYVANTANAVIVENTAFSQGISVVSNTDITIANPGVYNLQFSFQLTNSGSQIHTASFWIRLNGVDYPASNTDIDVPSSHGGNSGKIVAAWNIMGVAANPGDVVNIMWSSTNSSVELTHIPAQISPTRPETASAIITLQQVA